MKPDILKKVILFHDKNRITQVLIIGYLIFIILSISFDSFFDRIGCPFYRVTKIPCAGCGATRAIKSLMSADIRTAINYNILAVVGFPIMIAGLFFPALLKFLEEPPYSIIIIVIVVAFFIGRAIISVS